MDCIEHRSDLPGTVRAPATMLSQAGAFRGVAERDVAVEMPVGIVYSSVQFAVMMATPADLEDFAYGFSRTEGVITAADEVRAVAIEPDGDALRLMVTLAPGALRAHLARRRVLSGRTACGLCGVEDLSALERVIPVDGPAPVLRLAAIRHALASLDTMQPLNRLARAVHAAAWADAGGGLVLVREDVGRHNALDKLAGALLRARMPLGEGFLVITSRCSFEMVEKAAAFGARSVVAISAPTSLAIDRARALDVTLIGVAREDSVTVFNGMERVI